ncbi:MAG TPA: FkbM family methyltransferase [Acidobacteriaceae bacterium]
MPSIGKMTIRLRQHRMFWLRPPLIFEGFMLGCMQRLVHKDDVVYDIGANIGLYSRFLTQIFHASNVYAFEPMESNRALLAENLRNGGCAQKVTIVPCAVGNEDGFCDFQVDDLTSNSGTLDAVTHGEPSQSRHQYGLPPSTVRVEVVRLDTFIATKGVPPPNVIKMDVEGAEALALEGARSLLLQHGPLLIIELHGAEVACQVLQVLWSVNYHCFGYFMQNGINAYKQFTPADLPSITGRYTTHFLVASPNEAILLQPIADYVADA